MRFSQVLIHFFVLTSVRWKNYLASWARHFKQYDRAHALYLSSLALLPDDTHTQQSLAMLYVQQEQIEKAIALLQVLHQSDHDNLTVCFNLAYLYQISQQLDAAKPLFLHTLALNPEHDRAWYGLGLLYIAQHQLDEAMTALLRNTELQPMSPYGWYQLAKVYQQKGDLAQAQRIQAKLSTFAPSFARGLAKDLANAESTIASTAMSNLQNT